MQAGHEFWMELIADMDRDENNVVPDGVGELDKQLYEAGAGKWLGCDEQGTHRPFERPPIPAKSSAARSKAFLWSPFTSPRPGFSSSSTR